MARSAWPTLGLVLVMLCVSAAALDVVSDSIVVWDDDVVNRVTDVPLTSRLVRPIMRSNQPW
ncbi:MAG: hypothetical protein LJE93_05280 [Acidobacteria bacterium]|jgi:hypothetical protein|nr:hypothetical protein [Acidobacteriota bacterium]